MAEEPEEERRGLKEILEEIYYVIEDISDTLRTLREISGMEEVARRYAVTNSFDSLLTMLGVLMGGFISGLEDPSVILSTLVGGAMAILISGVLGTYLTERAERASRIRELEGAVLMDLDETIVSKAERISAILVALASGVVPFLIMLGIAAPFYLTTLGLLEVQQSYLISFIEALTILFLIGTFLGSLSGENRMLYGLLLVGMGMLIVLVMLGLGLL